VSGWLTEGEAEEFWGRGEIVLETEREFVGDDGHDWHVVRHPSAACGANYADVERVDGSKASVRQAELLRRAGIALPGASE
jgi:hypothetical protein